MTGQPTTLGELRASGYRPRSVRDEIRANLVGRLRNGEDLFPGIVGYENSVAPALVNALLARHNIILLGLRGQAKSRILRQLADFLDSEIPVLAGTETNDDPFRPISKAGRQLVQEEGDAAPVAWIGREARYVEKLATPDVTVADLVGDVDPIRAARGGHLLADELSIHFGLLPRANRGIFAVNELPDLSGKVQVALFNVLQEGDIQIKGYPVRLPLDVLLVFTANPEDYTARGKIISPLKDRIGAEVTTHYPRRIEEGMAITRQEAWLDRDAEVVLTPFVVEIIERVAFLARQDKRVDQRSGVSQRMPITALETAVSNAERRRLLVEEDSASLRLGDVYAALPAITGKLELEYEGEVQGGENVARDLVAAATREVFDRSFDVDDLEGIVSYFEDGGVLQIGDASAGGACLQGLRAVPGLLEAVEHSDLASDRNGAIVAAAEVVLEGLAAHRRISRNEAGAFRRAPRRPSPPGHGGFSFGEG